MAIQYLGRAIPHDSSFTLDEAPRSFVFFESQGERAVDPLHLVDVGIFLWREQVLLTVEADTSHLWGYAAELLEDRSEPHPSHVEWLRRQITLGLIAPKGWNKNRPYPYRGLLVSAIYFQEAKRSCEQGNGQRACHLVTTAYYYLGMNTTPTNARKAWSKTVMRHAKETAGVRRSVLEALRLIGEKGTARSLRAAKDEVVKLFRTNEGMKKCLEQYVASTKSRVRHSADHDMFDRLRNMLDDWASPDHAPYPKIEQEFSRFKRSRPSERPSNPDLKTLTQSTNPFEQDFYFRTIDDLEDGGVSVTRLSRDGEV